MPASLSVLLHAGPGLDDYTLHLANGLADFARVGYSISTDMLDRYGDALDPRVAPLPFNRPRRRHLWGITEMSRLAKEIKAFQPDIVHTQNDGLWESLLVHLLGDLPIVNTVHDPIKHIDQRTTSALLFQKIAIQRASGWVVHSENLRKIFVQKFRKNSAHILVHPHGIFDYYTRFAPAAVEREKTILFFGEVRHNKGADILLHAFDSLDLPDWQLIIAGRGSGLSDENALIKKMEGRLDIRNRYIPDAEVAELFSNTGIVAMPYRHGSQSGVLALAAAFGCPVLATRMGSLPELVQDRQEVLFVDPENERALAEGILSLADDAVLRQRLGENIKTLAQRAWSWRRIARETVDFYAEVLAS